MRARRRFVPTVLLGLGGTAFGVAAPTGVEAATAPTLSFHLEPAARTAAPGALPLTLRLVHRGGDPVRVAPLRVDGSSVAARVAPATVHLAVAVLGERRTVPASALRALRSADAAPALLAAGQALTLDVDVPLDTGRPGHRAIQAVYQSEGPGLLAGAVASDVLRVVVGRDAPRTEPLLVSPARADPTASTPGPRLLVDLPRLGGAPEGFRAVFTGTGTTHAVEARVENPGADAVLLRVPTGLRFVGRDERVQVLMATGAPSVLCPPRTTGRVLLPAFCTDRDKAPPDVGVVLDALDPGHPRVGPATLLVPERPDDAASPLRLEQLAVTAHAVASERAQFLPTGHYRFPDAALVPAPGATEVPSPSGFRRTDAGQGLLVLDAVPMAPPGPFERARSPQPAPTAVFTREPWSGRPAVGRGPAVIVLGLDHPTRTPPPSFADTAILWTVWAATNDGGAPNPSAISTRTEAQAKAQGVTDARAKAAGAQVAAEVVPVVTQALARAHEAVELEVDFGALDLSLKGAPPPPEPSPPTRASAAPSPATLERHRALEAEMAPEAAVQPDRHRAFVHGTRTEVEGPALPPSEAPETPPPPPPPPPKPLEFQTDWWRRHEDRDLEPAERMFLRVSGNRVDVWAETLPHRFGGTYQWYDFGAAETGAPDFGGARPWRRSCATRWPRRPRSRRWPRCATPAHGASSPRPTRTSCRSWSRSRRSTWWGRG